MTNVYYLKAACVMWVLWSAQEVHLSEQKRSHRQVLILTKSSFLPRVPLANSWTQVVRSIAKVVPIRPGGQLVDWVVLAK